MATFYGSDTSCVTDLPLIDVQVSDAKTLIGQRIARRLTTPRGALGLIGDDGDFGWDVRQLFNGQVSPSFRQTAAQQIAAEVLKDEQVESCEVSVDFVASTGSLTIQLTLTTSAGPFILTALVSALDVSLIFEGL